MPLRDPINDWAGPQIAASSGCPRVRMSCSASSLARLAPRGTARAPAPPLWAAQPCRAGYKGKRKHARNRAPSAPPSRPTTAITSVTGKSHVPRSTPNRLAAGVRSGTSQSSTLRRPVQVCLTMPSRAMSTTCSRISSGMRFLARARPGGACRAAGPSDARSISPPRSSPPCSCP